MSKVQQLRDKLKLRLTAADEEIFELFDGMIADYEGMIADCEEEICRLKEENKGWKVLDAVFKPQVHLYRADMQQLLVSKEDVLPEQQEENLKPEQRDSKPPNIKEEQEELWSEDEEKPQSSRLHQIQRDESSEVELLSSNSTEPRTLKTEADGEDCGGSQPARDSGPCSHLQPHTDVHEEQSQEEREETEDNYEGVEVDGVADSTNEEDPLYAINQTDAVLTSLEHVTEEASPAFDDVLMSPRHLHLPGLQEVENLAVLLMELLDLTDRYIVPASLRKKIATAAGALHDMDKSSQYQSKWGSTLFGRCLGPDSAQHSAAQKTKFRWMRYPHAAQITEDSRLLYLIIKMLKNLSPANQHTSSAKATSIIRAQYARIQHRVQDDPILCKLRIPLPNMNAKSINMFITREEKKVNLRATVVPKVKRHQKFISDQEMPEAPKPESLTPPDRPHVAGKRHGGKTRLDLEELEPSTSKEPDIKGSTGLTTRLVIIRPRLSHPLPVVPFSAPIMMVVPTQPCAPSVQFQSASQGRSCFVQIKPPAIPRLKPLLPDKSVRPCAACQVPKCGGLRKRYTPSKEKTEGSLQKIFTYCPTTGRSTTPGFRDVYTSYEHFKQIVDEELTRRKNNM